MHKKHFFCPKRKQTYCWRSKLSAGSIRMPALQAVPSNYKYFVYWNIGPISMITFTVFLKEEKNLLAIMFSIISKFKTAKED